MSAEQGFDTIPQDLSLSVVIPVYNECKTLPRILRAVTKVLPGVPREIILVDDGSRDGTREWISSSFPAESNPVAGTRLRDDGTIEFSATGGAGYDPVAGAVTIRPQLQPKNGGKGSALRTGISLARNEVVVIQDADLEYDPADWMPMYRLFQIGTADVVYGSRFYGRPHRALYFYHYMGNRTISFLFNVLFDQTLTDLETCYKMFRREVVAGALLQSNDFGIEVELSAVFARPRRWRIYECAISYYGRTYDEGKKIGWRDGVLALWYILKFRFARLFR
jgi:glycosyltransferase involved in cell wall biosynthesis